MQLEQALARLQKLVEEASLSSGDPAVLSDNWQEIQTLMSHVLAPALIGGAALPLDAEKKSEIEKLITNIASLEQNLQLKLQALAAFVPYKRDDSRG